jgi:hypothetical protein
MRPVAELEYWITTPDAEPRRVGRVNPLAFFNPGECGAWVATLRALRALPSTSTARNAPYNAPADEADDALPPLALDPSGA